MSDNAPKPSYDREFSADPFGFCDFWERKAPEFPLTISPRLVNTLLNKATHNNALVFAQAMEALGAMATVSVQAFFNPAAIRTLQRISATGTDLVKWRADEIQHRIKKYRAAYGLEKPEIKG